MSYYFLECKRMFTNKGFYVGLAMTFSFLLCGAWDVFSGGYDLVEAMIFSLSANTTAILALFWTMVGSIPWALSYSEERGSGYLHYLQLKTGKQKYIISKFCNNILASFVVILLPEVVLLIAFILMKGTHVALVHCQDISYMPQVARNHPVVYCLMLMAATAFAAAAYSSVCVAVTCYIRTKFIALVTPFVVYIVTCLSLRPTRMFWIAGSFLYNLNDMQKPYYGIRFVVDVGMIGVSFLLFVWGNRDEEKTK